MELKVVSPFPLLQLVHCPLLILNGIERQRRVLLFSPSKYGMLILNGIERNNGFLGTKSSTGGVNPQWN